MAKETYLAIVVIQTSCFGKSLRGARAPWLVMADTAYALIEGRVLKVERDTFESSADYYVEERWMPLDDVPYEYQLQFKKLFSSI